MYGKFYKHVYWHVLVGGVTCERMHPLIGHGELLP